MPESKPRPTTSNCEKVDPGEQGTAIFRHVISAPDSLGFIWSVCLGGSFYKALKSSFGICYTMRSLDTYFKKA